jgi:hypothetical protein
MYGMEFMRLLNTEDKMVTKIYTTRDIQKAMKLTKGTALNRLKEINAPKDEMGYYSWSREEFNSIIRKLRGKSDVQNAG